MESSRYSYISSDDYGDSQEGQALLSFPERPKLTARERLSHAGFLPRQLGVPSKSAVLILVWTLVVSAIWVTTRGGTSFVVDKLKLSHPYDILLNHVVYVLAMFLYPLVGFIADVRCGRYKVILVGLCFVLSGLGFFSLVSVYFLANSAVTPFDKIEHHSALFYIFAVAGLLLLVAGYSIYNATVILVGLDQLNEAPNEYLGLFVHWKEWFELLGLTFGQAIIAVLYNCSYQPEHYSVVRYIMVSLPFVFFIFISALLTFTCWKRHWFYVEPVQNNPYKMVIKVLNFVRKNKYPLRRSAFTFTGDESSSRLDFAKSRYGGPFTTEQVEDVKTFLKILVVLLALGPIFAMEIPISSVLPIFVKHVVKEEAFNGSCDWKKVMTDTYLLRFLLIMILFPVYIWLIYSVLRRCIPKQFIRLGIGIVILLVGLLFIFQVDLLGHYFYYHHHGHGIVCMFVHVKDKKENHLDIAWAVSLVPIFLTEAGLSLILTTTFEFISAQSPRPMKGLIFGALFSVRAIIKVIISIFTLPFSMSKIWGTKAMMNHPPPVTNCGFGYFLFILIIGILAFLVFLVVAKRYKYRERDDPPFNQATVERVWANG